MCETPDHGIKLLQWHTLLFEEQVAVDMRVVCPQDVKKMLQQQARLVDLKECAAKLECEELTEGVWLEPIQAMLRRKTNEALADEHRHVMRMLVAEGGWVQKRLRHWLVG